MNASPRSFLNVLAGRKAVAIVAAAMLLAAATGWAMTGGSLQVGAGGGQHYNLQPVW
jgi:hypothetical protein